MGALDLGDLGVPPESVARLVAWNARYQAIMPTDTPQRSAMPAATVITELDELGVELTQRLAHALGEGSKVTYYSEGRLCRLFTLGVAKEGEDGGSDCVLYRG